MDKIANSNNLGIFIAGYRWSGSGAVSDWLAGHEGLCRVKGSEDAFGEIRALNYGLRFLVQTAAGRIPYGERLGRWAICPDPDLWNKILGKPLTQKRGIMAPVYSLVDLLYYMAARFYVIPPVTRYKNLLDLQLGVDFRSDKEYLDIVSELADSLREYMDKKEDQDSNGPEHNKSVQKAASKLLLLLYNRLSSGNKVLVFDNAISGLYPELFNLIDTSIFTGQVIIFVRRDPRDQFVELVKYSGSTFSWSTGKFIDQYRKTQEKTRRFIDHYSKIEDENKFIRQVTFENFVLNRNNLRTDLKSDLQDFWKRYNVAYIENWNEDSSDSKLVDGGNGLFNPDKSKVNIGIWKNSGLVKQIRQISKELDEYID